uniref:Alanine racemase n=1 Tax=Magnetococcus massalia (strain MO-1) TaxID=451514 RepID=A0A1S7LLS7_MAGMO|nr:Alanine racemase [Candidatus Magnetococcus massalia]
MSAPIWSQRPTWLEVDLAALRHNGEQAKRAVADGVGIWPVIKADGYGVGSIAAAHALESIADGFCVAMVEEGEQLRMAGVTKPIVVMSGYYGGLEKRLCRGELEIFLSDEADLDYLAGQCEAERPLTINIKVDTGMARLGFTPEAVPALLKRLDEIPSLRVKGLVTHLACADQLDGAVSQAQVACFKAVLDQPEIAKRALVTSIANSAGILAQPASHAVTTKSWVRPGIMLYGASPFHPQRTAEEDGLKPVVRWVSHVQRLVNLEAGQSLGYGHTYTAPSRRLIAQIPVGYADGYNRLLSNKGEMLLKGVRVPVVGIVCMDSVAVDVTALDGVESGDEVVVLGSQRGNAITLEEMASWLGTIPYEVLTRISQRVPRRYG